MFDQDLEAKSSFGMFDFWVLGTLEIIYRNRTAYMESLDTNRGIGLDINMIRLEATWKYVVMSYNLHLHQHFNTTRDKLWYNRLQMKIFLEILFAKVRSKYRHIQLVSVQDVPFALILWYVSKTIYLL